MKHIRIAFIVVGTAASTLAACSQSTLDAYQAGAARFTAGLQTTQQVVAQVDATIAQINASLYQQCKGIQTIGNAAVKVSSSCTKAGSVIGGVNAAINSLCQNSPAASLASTADVAANAYVDVKTQLATAKAACAAGG